MTNVFNHIALFWRAQLPCCLLATLQVANKKNIMLEPIFDVYN